MPGISQYVSKFYATVRHGDVFVVDLDGEKRRWEVATKYAIRVAMWDRVRKVRLIVSPQKLLEKPITCVHLRHWRGVLRHNDTDVVVEATCTTKYGKLTVVDGPPELVGKEFLRKNFRDLRFLRTGNALPERVIRRFEYRSGTTALQEAHKINLTQGSNVDTVPAPKTDSENTRRRE